MLKKLLFILLLSPSINIFSSDVEEDPRIELMNILMGKDKMDQMINSMVQSFISSGMPLIESESSLIAKLKKLFGEKFNQKIIDEVIAPEFTHEEIIQLVQILKTPLMKKYLSKAPVFIDRCTKIIIEHASTFNFDE